MDARDIILPVAAVTLAATAGAHAHAQTGGYDSNLNQVATWGSNCVKTDMSGEVMTYSVPDSSTVSKVIVKGGTQNAVYTTAPFTNLTAPINPRNGKPYAISHVIVCSKDGTVVATQMSSSKEVTVASHVTTQDKTNEAHNQPKSQSNNEKKLPATPATKETSKAVVKSSDEFTGKSAVQARAVVSVNTAKVPAEADIPMVLPETGARGALAVTAAAGTAVYAGGLLFRRKQDT